MLNARSEFEDNKLMSSHSVRLNVIIDYLIEKGNEKKLISYKKKKKTYFCFNNLYL